MRKRKINLFGLQNESKKISEKLITKTIQNKSKRIAEKLITKKKRDYQCKMITFDLGFFFFFFCK